MHIAILGATSQIAKDLIVSFSAQHEHGLTLFARRTEAVEQWLISIGEFGRYGVAGFDAFGVDKHFDAIINFVGSGNPAQTVAMGASIFDVTLKYDEMALNYLRHRPNCRYLFLSSGVAYGSTFDEPVDESTKAVIAINNLQPQDWYAVAKLHAECRHRSLTHLPIIDIRVFNYFSHTMDLSARFFITDIMRAIQTGETLLTSSANIVRDYLGPSDFYQLVLCLLDSSLVNDVVDCYTKQPVDKVTLLSKMQDKVGLTYEVRDESASINATGLKMNYYSINRRAQEFGFSPTKTSLDSILQEIHEISIF